MDPKIRHAFEENIHQARQFAKAAAEALAFDDRRLGEVPDDELLLEVEHAARCCAGVSQLLALGAVGETVPDPDAPRPAETQPADDNFVELLRRFPLRPLERDKDVAAARRVRDSLIAREPLGPASTVYAAALCQLIAAFKDGHRPARRRQPFASSRKR